MKDSVILSAIQMASGPNVNANLLEAGRLLAEAAAKGAELVVLPENFAYMGRQESDLLSVKEVEGQGPIQEFLAQQAKKHQFWLVGGTVPLQSKQPNRVRAASLLLDPNGQVVARYDKIHLFDVHLEETGESYTESKTIEGGDHIVVINTPLGRIGLAICYDLRFPEIFRQMLDQGVEIFVLPSAFTAITGKAHWESLLRARAIENLSYLVAANQGGYHVGSRETYGNSMIIDPWGNILQQLPRGVGVIQVQAERGYIEKVRRNFPTINHRRFHCVSNRTP